MCYYLLVLFDFIYLIMNYFKLCLFKYKSYITNKKVRKMYLLLLYIEIKFNIVIILNFRKIIYHCHDCF